MKYVKKIVKEIESSLKKLDNFIVLIKALVILMVSYLLFFMIKVEPLLSLIPMIVYFLSSFFIESRMDHIKRVESKYPHIDVKIRTARDYSDKSNAVLEELEKELVQDLKEVRTSRFVSFPKMLMLMCLLIISVSASLYIASQDIRIVDFTEVVNNAIKRLEAEDEEPEQVDFTQGEESVMQVGNEKISVEINPVGMDFDFSDVQESADYEFTTSFPKEIFISSGAAYENEFTEEQQELIKRYFDKKNNK